MIWSDHALILTHVGQLLDEDQSQFRIVSKLLKVFKVVLDFVNFGMNSELFELF